jgi:hypothetical protein
MGDDVLFFPDALPAFVAHIERFALNNASVIGDIMPHPEGKTAFEHWSCNGGSQFGHYRISQEECMDAGDEYFYTSNIVSPTGLLRQNPFDESFPYPRYEDRELGYRLRHELGHKVRYLPAAKSYHKHRLRFREWLTKYNSFTWSALHFSQLYPNDKDLRRKVGITAAVNTGCFNGGLMTLCVDTINRLHPFYFNADDCFGGPFLRQQLETAFRSLQEFFRMNYLRRHLGLPEMTDTETGATGAEIMKQVLDRLEKEA